MTPRWRPWRPPRSSSCRRRRWRRCGSTSSDSPRQNRRPARLDFRCTAHARGAARRGLRACPPALAPTAHRPSRNPRRTAGTDPVCDPDPAGQRAGARPSSISHAGGRSSFWFEFASTYSYPAAMRVEALALGAGVELTWRPFLLGPIFAAQGWRDSPFTHLSGEGALHVARPGAHVHAPPACRSTRPVAVSPQRTPRGARRHGRPPGSVAGGLRGAAPTAQLVDDQDIAQRPWSRRCSAPSSRRGKRCLGERQRCDPGAAPRRRDEACGRHLRRAGAAGGDELFWATTGSKKRFAGRERPMNGGVGPRPPPHAGARGRPVTMVAVLLAATGWTEAGLR